LSADRERLFVSTQGVSPGAVETWRLSGRPEEKPAPRRSPAAGQAALGGEVHLTPDGRFLLCRSGAVLRLSAYREQDLTLAGAVEPVAAAVFAPGKWAALLVGDG